MHTTELCILVLITTFLQTEGGLFARCILGTSLAIQLQCEDTQDINIQRALYWFVNSRDCQQIESNNEPTCGLMSTEMTTTLRERCNGRSVCNERSHHRERIQNFYETHRQNYTYCSNVQYPRTLYVYVRYACISDSTQQTVPSSVSTSTSTARIPASSSSSIRTTAASTDRPNPTPANSNTPHKPTGQEQTTLEPTQHTTQDITPDVAAQTRARDGKIIAVSVSVSIGIIASIVIIICIVFWYKKRNSADEEVDFAASNGLSKKSSPTKENVYDNLAFSTHDKSDITQTQLDAPPSLPMPNKREAPHPPQKQAKPDIIIMANGDSRKHSYGCNAMERTLDNQRIATNGMVLMKKDVVNSTRL